MEINQIILQVDFNTQIKTMEFDLHVDSVWDDLVKGIGEAQIGKSLIISGD